MDFPLPDKYIKTISIYRTLKQNGDNSLIGAGFLHYKSDTEHKENLKFAKYGGRLLLRGTGSYTDNTGIESRLAPGCFINCFPDKNYCLDIVPDNQWVECYIVFGAPLLNSLLAMNILSSDAPLQFPGLNTEIIDKFDHLLAGISNASDSELSIFVPRIIELLILINKCEKMHTNPSPYSDIINEVTTALSIDLEKKIEIKALLKNHPISYDRFRFIFKQEIGISPGVYRINKKLEKARELLTSKQYKVYQVAEMLGYPDAYSFSKQFSRFVGISPKDYALSI